MNGGAFDDNAAREAIDLGIMRDHERRKYEHVYANLPNYKMGQARLWDAVDDLKAAHARGCRTYLDIGAGRGEMLKVAKDIGFELVHGTEVVKELCGPNVSERAIHELGKLPADSYDCISSFDVIEHLLPGDETILINELGRLARKFLIVTANNKPSVDPTTGNDLHINIRSYNEWDALLRLQLEPPWAITREKFKRYVSETWTGKK